VENLIVDKGYR